VLSPLGDIVLEPGHDSVEDLLLRAHVQLVAADDVHQLADGQQQELLALHHLLEVVLRELVSDAQQFPAGVCVGEGADAQAVGGVQLTLEELAADVLNLNQLQQTGGRKERLDIGLLDDDVGGVAKVNKQLHGVLVDVAYSDLRLARTKLNYWIVIGDFKINKLVLGEF